jgi:hypothetical protein
MIAVPLTAEDVLVAAQVGIARALEELEKSCQVACAERQTLSWDREINAAIIDYAMGTLRDRYWPGPLPDPYFPHDFVPDPPLAHGCDLGADGGPMAYSGARIRLPPHTAPPVLVVEIGLNHSRPGCPVHECTAGSPHVSSPSQESLGADGPPAAQHKEERDAQLFRKWIDPSNCRVYYWPGFAWGKAAMKGPA